jgi:hypothetical protein
MKVLVINFNTFKSTNAKKHLNEISNDGGVRVTNFSKKKKIKSKKERKKERKKEI